MADVNGKIVLMGSGELTATMVEVHKELISGLAPPRRAVFLDTPAGFQLNVKQISETAVRYFETRVHHPLDISSYTSADDVTPVEAESAFHTLRNAQFILIGPGSPTYAVRQMRNTPIPEIFSRVVQNGGCLVAASAAALTMGAYTLPVYEIYKVGEDLHWVDGLGVLGRFGLDLVVVPHWNNAEGGTHDTRRCFMGEARFRVLEKQLPDDVTVLGLDEHTACIIDLQSRQAAVMGIGRVIVKKGARVEVFTKGDVFPAATLIDPGTGGSAQWANPTPTTASVDDRPDQSTFWDKVHRIERDFQEGIAERNAAKATSALLAMDSVIWQGKSDLESDETISEAREMLRDQIVSLGAALATGPGSERDCLAPLVDELLTLRERLRSDKRFADADALRDSLIRARILVEDTPQGTRWRLGAG
jgi:cyanophycinase-like exopeptidase